MKTFVCELCGGTSFLKSEGVFICQSCQTQYTVEELRKNAKELSETEMVQVVQEEQIEQPIHRSETKRENNNIADKAVPNVLRKKREMNASDEEKADDKKKKKKKFGIFSIIGLALSGAAFTVFWIGLISALASKTNAFGNKLLLISGILEILIAFIIYRIILHIERYTCPLCAAKREHHREYLRTTEKETSVRGVDTETYTHHYRDTYVCPKCGETRVEYVKASGGKYMELPNGNVRDTRRDPKEF